MFVRKLFNSVFKFFVFDISKIDDTSNPKSAAALDKDFSIEDHPAIRDHTIDITELTRFINTRYPNLQEITKQDYDTYIENEGIKLNSSETKRTQLSANQQLQEFVTTVKNNTYGDPIIPGVILGLTTINVVGDIFDGDQKGEALGAWFDSLDGPLTIFGDGLAGIADVVNLPFMIVSHLKYY